MGRYDKIRVYDNGWKQPSRIRVYKKGVGWVDFGANNSDNNKDINVYKKSSNNFIRATLNKKVTYYNYQQGTGYTESSWSPNFNCGFSPSSDYGNHRFEFKATVYRRDSVSRRLYYSKSNSHGDCHVYITLNGNGSITVSLNAGVFYDSVASYTTPAQLSLNQWGDLQVWAEAGSGRLYIRWCGATYDMSSKRAWQVGSNTVINDGGARISINNFKLQTYSNNTGGTQAITYTAAEVKTNVTGSNTTWV